MVCFQEFHFVFADAQVEGKIVVETSGTIIIRTFGTTGTIVIRTFGTIGTIVIGLLEL